MRLFEDNFTTIDYESDFKILIIKRFNSKPMTDKIYRETLLKLLEMTLKHLPKGILLDNRELEFPIHPDTQAWSNKEILMPLIQCGVTTGAYVESADFIAQLSVEQTFETKIGEHFKVRFFENYEEAFAWLLVASN